MDFQKMMESRINEVNVRQDALIKTWEPYIRTVDSYINKKEGRSLALNEKRSLAQCLDNAFSESAMRRSKLFETTTQDSIAFLGVQLPN